MHRLFTLGVSSSFCAQQTCRALSFAFLAGGAWCILTFAQLSLVLLYVPVNLQTFLASRDAQIREVGIAVYSEYRSLDALGMHTTGAQSSRACYSGM